LHFPSINVGEDSVNGYRSRLNEHVIDSENMGTRAYNDDNERAGNFRIRIIGAGKHSLLVSLHDSQTWVSNERYWDIPVGLYNN